MALDICIETYGSVAPFVGSDSVAAVLRLRVVASARSRRERAVPVDAHEPAVFRAVDRLPFVLAQALWLVEICQCTYEEAAEELSITPELVGDRVAEAYRTIHAEIAGKPPD